MADVDLVAPFERAQAAIAFPASPAGSHVTGTTLHVDRGGRT